MFVGSWSPTIVTKFLSHSQSGRYKHISPTLPLWKSSQLPLRDEKQILALDILSTVLELITFEILAAKRLRLMGFDNRLIFDCFSNVVNLFIW